jgi:hypothetical protein
MLFLLSKLTGAAERFLDHSVNGQWDSGADSLLAPATLLATHLNNEKLFTTCYYKVITFNNYL